MQDTKKCCLGQNDFRKISENDPIAGRFPLRPVTMEDLSFTGMMDDDSIDTTAVFSDYDWVEYTYDARIPTKDIGTLLVRFEFAGLVYSTLYVRQLLPSALTGGDEHVCIDRAFNFPSKLFMEYMQKDLQARIRNMHDPKGYAYGLDPLVLEWYGRVIAEGTRETDTTFPDDLGWGFAWLDIPVPYGGKDQA